jgi:hypothetical protein
MRGGRGHRFFQGIATGALRRENLEAAARSWLNLLPDPGDDDDYADELIALGVDAEQIERARDAAEAFDDPDDTSAVVVWAENAAIVEVFTSCRWRSQVVVGDKATRIYEGIDAAEVAHCCDLLQVAAASRREVLWGVRIMEATSLPLLNRG